MLNVIGQQERFIIKYDGVEVASDIIKDGRPNNPGDGRIVIGRQLTRGDRDYASVEVDELLFFNEALSEDQIMMLKEHIVSE